MPLVPRAPEPKLGSSELQARLSVAEETLRALRNGEVDALVVQDVSPQVFTLSSADRPYRIFVENMRDGAATVSESGVVLYANERLSELVGLPLSQVMGAPMASFVAEDDREAVLTLGARGGGGGPIEVELLGGDWARVPVRVSASHLDMESQALLCLTFADLTDQNAQLREIDRLGRVQAERMHELERAQAALTRQATHDFLTGLPNRSLLLERVAQVMDLARRSGRSMALLFVDLDGFKQINDTRGHSAGDVVLRTVAERLRSVVRPMDSVSRLGGDEFVVLLPALASSLDAAVVGRRIAEIVDAPIELAHGAVSLTASVGISACDPGMLGRTPAPDALLQQADAAMYQAKSLGGAQVKLFDPTVLGGDQEMWIARIRKALDEDRFVLHAQPIVALATGAIVQRELLLRMRDDDDELIAPLEFLPTAERCGLIAEIDEWVVAEAMTIAAHGSRVAVNLSATSLGDPATLGLIEREIHRHAVKPENLVFEITETTAMNVDRARLFASRLVGLGCGLSLDDFGTGYASFTYLKELPAQYVKIDIEFVRNLANSARDRSVVKAIVGLAADFGQETVAEGVEDERTADILRELGVTFGQGYLFGRPGEIPQSVRPRRMAAATAPPRSETPSLA